MPKPVRCVVTGHNEQNKSVIQFDGPAPRVFTDLGLPGLGVTYIWKTEQNPVQITGDTGDSVGDEFSLTLPAGGSAFNIMELPPESQQGAVSADEVYSKLGDRDYAAKGEDLAHPLMHRTDTIDFAILLDGSITLITDTGETDLNPGDVVVQLGCNHMWVNRGDTNCRVAFFMLPATINL